VLVAETESTNSLNLTIHCFVNVIFWRQSGALLALF